MGLLTGLSIASAVMGVASGIGAAVESIRAANETRKKQRMIDNEQAKQEALFNKQYYQDITDRTEIQDLLRRSEEQDDANRKRDEAAAAVTGATDEAKLAMADSRNKSRSNILATIASNASQLKDAYLNDWKNRLSQFAQQRLGMQNELAGIHQNASNQWAQTAENAFKTSFDLAGKNVKTT